MVSVDDLCAGCAVAMTDEFSLYYGISYGIVEKIEYDPVDNDPLIGVRFPGWCEGHDLGQILEQGSKEGYWVFVGDIEQVIVTPDDIVLPEVLEDMF